MSNLNVKFKKVLEDLEKNIQNKAKLKTEHSFAISEHMCYHILYITDYVK